MNYERFIVEPRETNRDPLQSYFNSIAGFFGGGLTNFAFLVSSPTLIQLNLNEWVSLERVGDGRPAQKRTTLKPLHRKQSKQNDNSSNARGHVPIPASRVVFCTRFDSVFAPNFPQIPDSSPAAMNSQVFSS
jgi:hypothetical protein